MNYSIHVSRSDEFKWDIRLDSAEQSNWIAIKIRKDGSGEVADLTIFRGSRGEARTALFNLVNECLKILESS
jgi:hypothetical protein